MSPFIFTQFNSLIYLTFLHRKCLTRYREMDTQADLSVKTEILGIYFKGSRFSAHDSIRSC